MRAISLPLLAAALGLALATAASADEAASEGPTFVEKLQTCGACHGEKGDKPLAPDYPILAGQHADYLAQALRDYRDGRRSNPIMTSQVQALSLTDPEMEALGRYFAEQPSGLRTLKP